MRRELLRQPDAYSTCHDAEDEDFGALHGHPYAIAPSLPKGCPALRRVIALVATCIILLIKLLLLGIGLGAGHSDMRAFGLSILLALVPGSALAAVPLVLTYDTYRESKTLIDTFLPGEAIRLDGALPNRGGSALTQIFNFTSGSTALSLSAAWRLAPTDDRIVGVNIDLFDSFSNTLVASDAFLGVFGDLARSQFVTSGLNIGGKYTLVLTGAAALSGRYQIDMDADATPPPAPTAPSVPKSPALSLFDTLQGTKDYGAFAAGNQIQIDGIISESGAILDVATFAFGGGDLSASIVWLFAPGEFRTTGVNVDIFDSFNALVASDTFMGVTDGQAFSQFAVGGLNPGTYRLVFTGTAQQGGRYRIDLGTSAVAPGFVPIPTGVPEPATWALMLVGFGMIGYACRRGTTPGYALRA